MSNCRDIDFKPRYHLQPKRSDPYDDERVKNNDHMLHQTLSKIFHEQRLTRYQIKELLCAPKKHSANENSIFMLILEQEPTLGKMLLKGNERKNLSLLWIAVLSCYQNTAELLVNSGAADLNELYGSGEIHMPELTEKSSLLHALLNMYPSSWNDRFIALLIDHGADFNAQDSYEDTVLNAAVGYGRVKVAEKLLEKGADVNAANFFGMTPVLEAARSYREINELLPLLMRYGADIKSRDSEGRNVLHYLAGNIVEHTDLARMLIEKGASLDDRTFGDHYQPIHGAAFSGHNELIKLFLDHGADVNARAIGGEFPLYFAAMTRRKPTVLLTLLKRGANIDLKTKSGRTALHVACDLASGSLESSKEKIKVLLSVDANILNRSKHGHTPFDSIDSTVYRTNQNFICLILRTIALRKACLPQQSIEFKIERITRSKYPEYYKYYQNCIDEIGRTKSTRFIENCTIFELLTKCQREMAGLMRNREFERNFRQCDLSVFPMYAEDIREAFERAQLYFQSMLDQEEVIDEAVYNALPYVVMRKVVRYILYNVKFVK